MRTAIELASDVRARRTSAVEAVGEALRLIRERDGAINAFVFLDAIPRTSVGKFKKSALREQFANWKWES